MKTKISIALISLLFMMACGTAEQPKEGEQQPGSNKIILKAYNNMYVVLNGDSELVANEVDVTKAAIFEKIDQGNGKWALKSPTGRFVSDDKGRWNYLVANRTSVGGWEQFDIIEGADSKTNIKTSAGKIVSADGGNGFKLVGNRDNAGEWEAFTIEPK
jgi:hypothetical protein